MAEKSTFTVHAIPYASDNYAYVLRNEASNLNAIFDCGSAEPVLNFLAQKNWELDYIFATHFHGDHTAGIPELTSRFKNAKTIKPAGENRLQNFSIELDDLESISFGDFKIEAIRVPAHTQHCTSYYIKPFLFVGDSLFSAGCGRLFEGDGRDLLKMMDRYARFPDDTQIFFGHEYTFNNVSFAKTIESNNSDLNNYYQKLNIPQKTIRTTPSTIAYEKKINPFLRIDQHEIIQKIDLTNNMQRHERIAVLRNLKDRF
jgi:hydroxyacylglutathione hydrolase